MLLLPSLMGITLVMLGFILVFIDLFIYPLGDRFDTVVPAFMYIGGGMCFASVVIGLLT